MWLTQVLKIGYKCLISPFSPSNVDILDPYFYMSFFNVYYITLCRLHEKHSILSEVKIWQMCYSWVVTLVVAHYIVDLPLVVFGCLCEYVFGLIVYLWFIVPKSPFWRNILQKLKVDLTTTLNKKSHLRMIIRC
jgi:hypothetical protein